MSELSFVWDSDKNILNQTKHDGIDFDEAKTVFFYDYARTFDDSEHSIGELEELIFAYSNKN